ncbi:MAG: elongation factor G [Anaerolineales bacterium]|nr:elongation factor G [Anaerolineales bacterium]MCB8954517.1 elongation factor G [Ardenticatenales bacterium]
MKEYQTGQIRNIALVSHNGAGKTTLVERLLFDTGVTTRMGSVQNGTAAMDFEEEEVARNSSIATAIAPIEWDGVKLNFLDTPGFADFVGEVNSALRVVDGVLILVEAVAGVEVGTELVFKNAADHELPRIILINKMDRENVRVDRVMASLNENLDANFVNLQLPVGEGQGFRGVVDVLRMKAFIAGKEADIPADMVDAAEEARMLLVEAAAEGDDALIEKYLEGEELTDEEMIRGIKGAMAQGMMVPVCFAAPQEGVGVKSLVDLLVQLMPSPDENDRSFMATRADDSEATYAVSDKSPLAAFVFKTREDAYGKMSYLRVFGGVLESDSRVWHSNAGTEVRVGTLNVLRGKEQISVPKLHSGDIGMVVKLGDAGTNDTLSTRADALVMPSVAQPNSISSVAIHPVAQSDVAKLSPSLNRLVAEDPTLHWATERATRETILSGMGVAHLDIAVKKMQSKFGVNLTTSVPKIPYRETITGTNSAEYTHKKQTGGAGQYARVFLRVESLPDDDEFDFASEIFGGAISAPFVAATEKGCRQALESGPLAGYPVVGIKAIVYDGKEHPVDSKEIAFQIAGREGFKKAALGAGPVLLEPIYEIEVSVPADNMGDIMGDLNSRRARVLGMDQVGAKSIVKAEVPLAEVQTYAADLRSMTQGRGIFSMKFLRYGRVPGHLQQQIVDARRKEIQEQA